jgi:hypothetical protein
MSQLDKTIKSRELLKPEFRTKYQTTTFIYKALEIAEKQIEEQHRLIETLIDENLRIKKNKDGKGD